MARRLFALQPACARRRGHVVAVTLILVGALSGCGSGGLGPEGGDPVDAAGQITSQLNASVSTTIAAIANNDSDKLTAFAVTAFQTSDVPTIMSRYGGHSVEKVPSRLEWDHPGEVALGFKVRCTAAKSVVFHLEFVVDGSTWRPVLGPPTAAAEARASQQAANQQIDGPPPATSAGSVPEKAAVSTGAPAENSTYPSC